jgi:hypothetical protein
VVSLGVLAPWTVAQITPNGSAVAMWMAEPVLARHFGNAGVPLREVLNRGVAAIVSGSAKSQVCRIYAQAIVAEVTDEQPLRGNAMTDLVSKPMSAEPLSASTETSVPVMAERSFVTPAFLRIANFYATPKPTFKINRPALGIQDKMIWIHAQFLPA